MFVGTTSLNHLAPLEEVLGEDTVMPLKELIGADISISQILKYREEQELRDNVEAAGLVNFGCKTHRQYIVLRATKPNKIEA